jgi:MFS family permease
VSVFTGRGRKHESDSCSKLPPSFAVTFSLSREQGLACICFGTSHHDRTQIASPATGNSLYVPEPVHASASANLTAAICRFAEPIALTSVYPYLPEMMESFGVPENDIARWAGIASATFSICQACTGMFWGAASDKYGRKPMILIGLFNTMLTMLMWGLSTNLTMALASRALQGLGNGNVGILRTTVAELCPWKELQPRAFSIMPLVYTVGAIIGPTFGGLLSNPLGVDPRKPHGSRFLERFPYILPNLAASLFFTVGIIVGWLFLKESLESKKHHQDLGLRTGAKLTAYVRKMFHGAERKESTQDEREPLLRHQKIVNGEAEQTQDVASETTKEEAPKIRDILTYQTTLNLVCYTLLAFYTLAYDQVSFQTNRKTCMSLTINSFCLSSCTIHPNRWTTQT